MTASLYRRLTDIPRRWITSTDALTGLVSAMPADAATTADLIAAGASPIELARSCLRLAKSDDRRVFVATLSAEQAAIIADDPDTASSQRIVRWLSQAARETPLRQRLCEMHDRAIVRGREGQPGAVVILWDGSIRSDTSTRTRVREARRYTLAADVIAWIGEEAERRGESASAVVEGAIRAMMRGES